MDIEDRVNLIKQVGEEIITESELRKLLETKQKPVAYDGFEPSGNVHIAQGVLRAINVNKMLRAGCKFKMLVADWHAWANNKIGGDLEKIKVVGEYLIEIWKACGMKAENIEFVWVSDLVKEESYWRKVMQIARNTTIKRIVRCCQIMGRRMNEILKASQIIYPCMQAADIFHLGVDIAQLGMDQRKVNMLARELGPKLGYWKPVAVHHHMLLGLTYKKVSCAGIERTIELKMSKSKPESAIFMTDSQVVVKEKILNAYCPLTTEENPILEYCKYIIFEKFDSMVINRPKKYGGSLEVHSFKELCELYKNKQLHPLDLKIAVAEYINRILEPVRKYFVSNKKANRLLKQVKSFEVTR